MIAGIAGSMVSSVGSSVLSSVIMGGGNAEKQHPLAKLSTFMGVSTSVQESVLAEVQAMDIDNATMGKDIGALITNPLTACITAQTQLNDAYITDFLRLCEVEDGVNDEGVIVPRVARMTVNTLDGATSIEIPLLTLVQPAQLAITSCHIDFTAEVTNSFNANERASSSSASDNTKTPGIIHNILFGENKTTTTLSSTSSADKTINSTKKNVYTVSVRADQVENTGMAFLQELLKTSMKDSITRTSK